MNNLIPANQEDIQALQIANLFLVWKSEEKISDELWIPEAQVKYILSGDAVQKYINTTTGNEELTMNLKRIRRANWLQDTIIDKIEEFLDDPEIPVAMRKDSHVSLLKDVLLKQLPNTIGKTIGLAIQMNFGKWSSVSDNTDETLQGILKRLTPWQIILFWEIIDKVGNLFLQGRVECITQLQKILQDFDSEVNRVVDSETIMQ